MNKDSLNTPLPDVQAYLDRIGCSVPVCCDLEALNRLIFAHQCHIPFEDLDIYLFHRQIPLDIPSLYDKIVTRRRGGYCFELNALFTRLLLDLGFRVRSVFCRMHTDGALRPCLHRALAVSFPDGLYFADVGYGGPMPAFALKIVDGWEGSRHGEHFGIARYAQDEDGNWWTLWRLTAEGTREELIDFNLFPQTFTDFTAANAFCCSGEAVFSKSLMVNLRTGGGHISMTDDLLRVRSGSTIKEEPVRDVMHRSELLQSLFGIILPRCCPSE